MSNNSSHKRTGPPILDSIGTESKKSSYYRHHLLSTPSLVRMR